MFISIDGEDTVAVLVFETESDAQRLVLNAVPGHVPIHLLLQDLVVPVIPVNVVLVYDPGEERSKV